MDNPNSQADYWSENNDSASYALSGKIMLSAIVILFAVVVLMVSLHIYARWYLHRTRRRPHTRRRRRSQLVFFLEPPTSAAQCRLDSSILKSLPVFVYSPQTHGDLPECAVCLSEFEENEQGRRLPKCNHCFHIGCIDMWFHSHSTCPMCRSVVDAETSGSGTGNPGDVVISVPQTEGASASALCSTCPQDEGSSSVGSRRKATELAAIEVPGGDDSLLHSPATQVQKSPGGRMLSLKRILSRDRKSMLSPTASVPPSVSCGSVAVAEFEVDLERATEGTQPRDSR